MYALVQCTRPYAKHAKFSLQAGSDVDVCCLMQLLKDWLGICRAVLAIVKIASESHG